MKQETDKPHPVISKPPATLRLIRSQPYLYSAMCKALLFYSRHIAASSGRVLYRGEKRLFSMSDMETTHCEELRNRGFTVVHNFFDSELVDRIYAKADRLFRDLQIDFRDAYSVQNRRRASLEGLSYRELELTEKMISLKDPLINIPECVDIAFNESILKIVTNFLRYIPSRYKPMIVRDFPSNTPREASNFHKDNDEADSVQIFVYLVDIDKTRGPLIYVPGSNHYDVKSCAPRLGRDLGINENDGRISDSEIEKYYPKESWAVVRAKRGSVAIIHGNGLHKGPAWSQQEESENKPRTAIRIDITGYKPFGTSPSVQERRIRRESYDRLNRLQKLFTTGYVIVDS
jgi:ectoine hydroxylase-related dioxygenase (phytanoyl-CoA dioxygenase family)